MKLLRRAICAPHSSGEQVSLLCLFWRTSHDVVLSSSYRPSPQTVRADDRSSPRLTMQTVMCARQ